MTTRIIRHTLPLTLLLLALAGCQRAIVGHWHLHEAIPNREVFSISDAAFHKDGTFNATLTIEGRTESKSGQYSFNGWELTLRPDAGGQHKFPAVRKLNYLEITNQRRKVVLKKD